MASLARRHGARNLSSLLEKASFHPRVRSISTFGVLGGGQMGTGIAIVAARKLEGSQVVVLDPMPGALERSEGFVDSWAAKEKKKGRMDESQASAMKSRMSFVSDFARAPALDFAVEAVPEKFELKSKVFQELCANGLRDDAVLASNTSSISITKLAAVVSNPGRVIGMHFMNPVPVMALVEVIRGLQTTDETHAKTLELVAKMGKEPATSLDRPGFIANRVLMPYINEAVFALQEGIATREDLDKIMKLGTNVPMGPLTLADFIGLDTCLAIMRVLHSELGDSKYRPAPLLVNYVEAGYLGKKSGRGFYEYK